MNDTRTDLNTSSESIRGMVQVLRNITPHSYSADLLEAVTAERDTVARRAGELELKVKDLAKKVTSHAMLLDEAHEALCRCADGFDAILKLAASIDKVAPRAGEGGGLLTLPGHARAVSASIRKALE